MVLIRCPICREKFRWDIEKFGYPDLCPNKECKSRIAHDRDDDDVVLSFIRTSQRTASIDKVYRDMEAGSEVRAQVAADMLGIPAVEMSGLKITNLRDNQRSGDLAIPPEGSSPVTQMMQQTKGMTGFGAQHAVEYSSAVMSGPHPNAGAKMRTMIQSMHPDIAGSQTGLDMDTKQRVRLSGDVVSDRPANEVLQPGYRRRG